MHPLADTGRVIAGRYRLQVPIGRGAMGVVWRARDELLDREVAVKELQIADTLSEAERATAYERTLREAKTAARLNHPAVVTVYDVAEEEGRPWIVMQLVSSQSLDQAVATTGPMAPRRAAEMGHQLLSALSVAHAAGVLHRDVKPSNVLIAADGRAVLTDFGIATFQGDPKLTQTGMVMGSPGFTAPERIRGSDATPASDLWSLGATLYAAVEGHGPFERRGGAITTMSAIINEDAPVAPTAGALGPVIAALLAREPADRPTADRAMRMIADVMPLLSDRPAARPAGYEPTALSASPPKLGGDVGVGAGVGADAGVLAGAVVPPGAEVQEGQGDAPGQAGAAQPAQSAQSAQPVQPVQPVAGTALDHAAADPAHAQAEYRPGAGADAPVSPVAETTPQPVLDASSFGAAAGGAGAAGAGIAGSAVAGAAVGGTEVGGAADAWGGAAGSDAAAGTSAFEGSGAGSSAFGSSASRLDSAPPDFSSWYNSPRPATSAGAGGSEPARGPDAWPEAPPAHTQTRRSGRWWKLAIAVLAVLGICAGVAIVVLIHHDDQSHATSGGTSTTAAATDSIVTAINHPITGTPAGYVRHTQPPASDEVAGFSVATPGWTVSASGYQTYFYDPSVSGVNLLVDLTPHQFPGDMVREARTIRAGSMPRFPGYRQFGLAGFTMRGNPAAWWKFTWDNDGVRQEAIDLLFMDRSQSYALYATAPAADWSKLRPVFEEEMRTFVPAS